MKPRTMASLRARWALLGAVALGLVLVVAAVAKATEPESTIFALAWVSPRHEHRVLLAALACFLECLVGGLLLVSTRTRLVLWMGAALGVLLLIVHAFLMS